MRELFPECMQGVTCPDAVLQAAVVIPRQLLAARVRKRRGDKTFVLEYVRNAGVSSFSPRTTRMPRGRHSVCEDLLLMHIDMVPSSAPADVKRLQELVHAAVPHPLLLLISGLCGCHVSITPLLDGRLRGTASLALILEPASESISQLAAVFTPVPADSLSSLYARWQCACYALDLQKRLLNLRRRKQDSGLPCSFCPMETPEAAAGLLADYLPRERSFADAWNAFHKGPRKSPRRMLELRMRWLDERRDFLSFLSTHSIT